jgi:hypothetical protein
MDWWGICPPGPLPLPHHWRKKWPIAPKPGPYDLYWVNEFKLTLKRSLKNKICWWAYLSPVYTTLNFWYGTDKIGTSTTFVINLHCHTKFREKTGVRGSSPRKLFHFWSSRTGKFANQLDVYWLYILQKWLSFHTNNYFNTQFYLKISKF